MLGHRSKPSIMLTDETRAKSIARRMASFPHAAQSVKAFTPAGIQMSGRIP